MPVYSREQVEAHKTARSVWITYSGKVYDVTEFVNDHPGGADIVLQQAGTDVTEIMGDDSVHAHSASAYEMLEEYYIGDLAQDEAVEVKTAKTVAGAWGGKGHAPYGMGVKQPFIDLNKPMLAQIFFGNFSKATYLEQVHIPRQVKGSAPIFGSPYLEALTKTPWYVIPIIYIPISTYCAYLALHHGTAPESLPFVFALGLLVWTFIEYSLHRFVFHIDDYLPDNQYTITLHFLLHGIHHFLPMDKMRLVMPPVLGLFLASFYVAFFRAVLPEWLAYGVLSGAFFGFMTYDCIHYYLHHARPWTAYLREQKTYHLDHHYKNANLGYGITSKLWDYLFKTLL